MGATHVTWRTNIGPCPSRPQITTFCAAVTASHFQASELSTVLPEPTTCVVDCPAAVLAAFFILVCYTTYLFFEVDSTAGCLMLPYVAWVAFANILNIGVVKKN